MSDKRFKLGMPEQEGQLSMMFTRGGPRTGAGRKGIGETRKVSLTLTKEAWIEIDGLCDKHNCSRSELFRDMVETYLAKS